jgi:hypothetical protein
MPGGAANTFPIITGLNVNRSGVPNLGINNAPFYDDNWYPTVSVTWVHGNHTFKFGGDLRHQVFGTHNDLSAGVYGFGGSQTALPSAMGQNLYGGSMGDAFASFALGQLGGASIGNDNIQWFHRKESGFYATDTWKAMPKLTINYGLRWDLEQMQHEQHDRVTQFSPTVANPSAGGLLGGTEYEGYGAGRCNCSFEKFYPWMIQPRLGVNYQLDRKTVLHFGTGLYSGQQLFMNEIGYSNQGFGFNQVTLNSPSPGIAAGLLSNGIPYNPADLTATHFDPGAFPNVGQTNSPPAFIVPNNGRTPRFFQTTIGFERVITNDLSVEANFIDNRGVWLSSDGLRGYNQLPPSVLMSKYGLDVTKPADLALLTQPISSAAVVARGFKKPYATFSSGNTLAQALRPFPQFSNVNSAYARTRLLLVEGPGNSLQHWDLHPGDPHTGSYPGAQEPEVLSGHRRTADAQLLLQLRGAENELCAERLEGCSVCGVDTRRHLPLPERLPDPDTWINKQSDLGDVCQWRLVEPRSRPKALPA